MSVELKHLIAAQLIVSSPDLQDGRRSALTLTQAGVEANERVQREVRRLIRERLACYSCGEIAFFIAVLERMSEEFSDLMIVDSVDV